MSRFALFDRSRLRLGELRDRGHDLTAADCWPLTAAAKADDASHPDLNIVADRIVAARQRRRSVILFMGGHPIKLGLSRFLIDMIERGWISHLATNGAGVIHDFELALVGGTSEDVAKWIKLGQFGLWRETSRLNNVVCAGAARGEGLGEAAGRVIEEERFTHRDLSICAAGWRAGVPVTCHATIGADIVHAQPNCDGAAFGQTSHTDFLVFARAVEALEGGVFLNIGSAVTGPEVYLKALSMARNVARQEGREIRSFTTAVFDLATLPANFRDGPPTKSEAGYYYRPWKTILVRTVADGGDSYYIGGDHRQTIPALWRSIASRQARSYDESAAQ